MMGPEDQDGCKVSKQLLVAQSAKGTLFLRGRSESCLEYFIVVSIVTVVSVQVCLLYWLGPPVVLLFSEFLLDYCRCDKLQSYL